MLAFIFSCTWSCVGSDPRLVPNQIDAHGSAMVVKARSVVAPSSNVRCPSIPSNLVDASGMILRHLSLVKFAMPVDRTKLHQCFCYRFQPWLRARVRMPVGEIELHQFFWHRFRKWLRIRIWDACRPLRASFMLLVSFGRGSELKFEIPVDQIKLRGCFCSRFWS